MDEFISVADEIIAKTQLNPKVTILRKGEKEKEGFIGQAIVKSMDDMEIQIHEEALEDALEQSKASNILPNKLTRRNLIYLITAHEVGHCLDAANIIESRRMTDKLRAAAYLKDRLSFEEILNSLTDFNIQLEKNAWCFARSLVPYSILNGYEYEYVSTMILANSSSQIRHIQEQTLHQYRLSHEGISYLLQHSLNKF